MAGSLALGVGVVDVDIPPIIHGVITAGGVGSLCNDIGAYKQVCIIYIRTFSIVLFLAVAFRFAWTSLTSCHQVPCALRSLSYTHRSV